MSDDIPPDRTTSAPPSGRRPRLHTEALERRGRWPGVVWAIPLAALLVVAYLGVQAIANRGVDVVVTFKTSGGARAGETPVVYKGVTVGHVVNIRIAENARDVDMTLRLEPQARSHMREGARFWLIGAEPSLTDLASLKAAVSGVSIGVAPGDGAPQRHFIGLSQPPVVPPETPGSLYVLEGGQIESTREGSGVYYHGLQVGRVMRVQVGGVQTMRLGIFIYAPFDKLVHAGTLFFNANAATIALSAGRLSAALGPGSSVITGGIEFDTPVDAANQPQSPQHTTFHFYPTEFQAADQPHGPQVTYRAVFRAAAQRPQAEAPVWLSGVRIGRVLGSHMSVQSGATEPATAVTLEIEPQAMGLPDGGDARDRTDAALRDLLRGGYRLQLGQYPPLVGTATLVLQKTAGAAAASLSGDEIPTGASAGLDELTGKLGAILDKVNAVPITAIGRDVRQITASLNGMVSSPELKDSLHKLNGTLTSVDEITRQVQPQVGPLIAKLNQAADELQGLAHDADAVVGGRGGPQDANLPDAISQVNLAARSIRELADYLGRHPESLVSGKRRSAGGTAP